MKILQLVTIITLLLGVSACMVPEPIKEEREHIENLVKNNPDIKHHYLREGSNVLHYAANGNPQKPALVIIHGTPGSWQQYARYTLNEALLEHFYVMVIDRPGWGESVLGGGTAIASFAQQAEIISLLLKKLRADSRGQPVILMGHSLGGSIIPQVAMDYPELVDGLLLFAGTVAPELSTPRWFNYLGNIPLVNYLIGNDMYRANLEVFALKDNTAAMASRWQELKAEVIAVQGTEDELVYPANSDYIEANFNPETTTVIRLEGVGHLFPMTMRTEVVEWAVTLLGSIESSKN